MPRGSSYGKKVTRKEVKRTNPSLAPRAQWWNVRQQVRNQITLGKEAQKLTAKNITLAKVNAYKETAVELGLDAASAAGVAAILVQNPRSRLISANVRKAILRARQARQSEISTKNAYSKKPKRLKEKLKRQDKRTAKKESRENPTNIWNPADWVRSVKQTRTNRQLAREDLLYRSAIQSGLTVPESRSVATLLSLDPNSPAVSSEIKTKITSQMETVKKADTAARISRTPKMKRTVKRIARAETRAGKKISASTSRKEKTFAKARKKVKK